MAENPSTNIKSGGASIEHGNPIKSDKTQPKIHAQKRGGK